MKNVIFCKYLHGYISKTMQPMNMGQIRSDSTAVLELKDFLTLFAASQGN